MNDIIFTVAIAIFIITLAMFQILMIAILDYRDNRKTHLKVVRAQCANVSLMLAALGAAIATCN